MSQIIRRHVTEPWGLATESNPSRNGEGSTRVYTLRTEQINSFFLTLRTARRLPVVALEKKIPKSRKIPSKPAYIPVVAPFGRLRRAQGLFRDVYCGTPGVDAPSLIEGE